MHFLKRVRCHWVAMFIFCCGFAQAAETVKIGFIDVLSGPFALGRPRLLEAAQRGGLAIEYQVWRCRS